MGNFTVIKRGTLRLFKMAILVSRLRFSQAYCAQSIYCITIIICHMNHLTLLKRWIVEFMDDSV